MPDWTSHLLIAYIAINTLGTKKGKPVYIGALLPDIFKAYIPISEILGITDNFYLNLFAPSHTVFGVIFSGLFISTFFADWRGSYKLILLGALLHFTVDLLLYPWGIETWIFYPLWRGDMGTGFLWSDSLLIPVVLLAIGGAFYLKNRIR